VANPYPSTYFQDTGSMDKALRMVRGAVLYDEHGAVMTEYVVLLTLVSLGAVAATVGLGAPLVRWYLLQRLFVLLCVP